MLISGYFGVRFKCKSIVHLYFTCLFVLIAATVIDYGVSLILGKNFSLPSILKTFILIFSHNKWWYIVCYFILLFISPIINTAIQHFTQKEFTATLILYSILQIYFAFFWDGELFGKHGYDVQHMVYMYLIGAYIKKYGTNLGKYCAKNLITYLILSGVYTIMFLLMDDIKWRCAYTNPVLILSSVALFCFMLSFSFHNKYINYFAQSMITVYLLHAYLGDKGLYSIVGDIASNLTPLMKFGWLVCVAVGCFLGTVILDSIRLLILPHIENGLTKATNILVNKVTRRISSK